MEKKEPKTNNLKKYLWISAISHIVFLVIFSGPLKCSNNDFIVPPSIQVDLVAPPDSLPQKNKTEEVAPPPPPPEKEAPKPEKKLPPKKEEVKKEPEGPKVNLEQEKKKKELKKKKEAEKRKKKKENEKKKKEKDRTNKQNEALNKLKQKAALDKLIKPAEEPTPNVGERINPGTSFSGLDSIQFNKYNNELKNHLYNNWSLPQWLSELDLKAQALVVIDKNGYVVRKEIFKSSGNINFDNTVLGAIEKASPFPVPPERLQSKVPNRELIFGFPEN